MDVISIALTLLKALISPPSATAPAEDPSDRRGVLLNRVKGYYNRRRRNWKTRRWLQTGGVFVLVATIVIYRFTISPASKLYPLVLPVGLLITVALFASSFSFAPYDFEIEIRQTEDELDLINSQASSIELDAQKLFKLHQLELNKYYDQTLRQSKWIFWAGLFCLFLGFGVIGLTIGFVSRNPSQDGKAAVAILGGVGAILSNFIGVVYLKMHSETVGSLTEFHNRLVKTHYLHFGNFLLAKIANLKLREASIAKVALNLSATEQSRPERKKLKSPARRLTTKAR